MDNIKIVMGLLLLNINKFRFYVKINHWGADSGHLHEVADQLHDEVLEFEDLVAERIGGIFGKYVASEFAEIEEFNFNIPENEREYFKGVGIGNLDILIQSYIGMIETFYDNIPDSTNLIGLKSDFETHISELNKLKYLSEQS